MHMGAHTHTHTHTHTHARIQPSPLSLARTHCQHLHSAGTCRQGHRHGNVEIRNYLRDSAGPRSLVFDLSIAHDRFGSSSHVLQNGLLTHPQDLDGPLRVAAQRKINAYGQQYADNQNISFLPAIATSTRMHGEFLRLLFLQVGLRRNSLPLLECHRKTTKRTRS